MKLVSVFSANQAFGKLSQMRLSPKIAYAILKYVRKVAAEYEIIEKCRVDLIHELTNTNADESANIEPGTKEHSEYCERFSAILETESDLKVCDIKLDDVIESLSGDSINALTAQEIGALEPFFKV